jgi:predicted oxidoreductase (fatty acid repression mutant protein)
MKKRRCRFFNEMNKKCGSHRKKNDGSVIFDDEKVISQLDKQIAHLAASIAWLKLFLIGPNATLCR